MKKRKATAPAPYFRFTITVSHRGGPEHSVSVGLSEQALDLMTAVQFSERYIGPAMRAAREASHPSCPCCGRKDRP